MSGISADTVVDGRYRLVSRLGSGGMADVWCAEDLQLGRKVALKLLHARFAEDAQFVERFRREASSAAGLQHPNVVAVYDRGEWEGTYYIAMEYLEGRSLKELVTQEAPLDPDRAIELTIQVLRAARFAHKRGIIHRDLKPHNVIIDSEGRAKVTDFGIAKAGASDMTQTGSIMGTAQYLSPEQAQGHAVSAQSDLYSIGIVLYELLTARIPFEGDSPVTIALKQVSETPEPPSRLNPAVVPELEFVVLRALAKDPAERYADADEFIAALEAVRSGQAPPPGQATTAFGAVVVEEEVVETAPPPERTRWWLWALLAALLAAGAIAAVLLLAREEKETVANVTGADVEVAMRRLRNDGFEPRAERARDPAPEGQVIAQDPRGGTRLEVGSVVTLTVSDGPGTAAVPDVEGATREQARARLRRAGFRVRERREPSADVDEGRAIGTRPPIGSAIEVGSLVTLIVSSGPEQVTVPDVTGEDVDDARARLARLGLEVEVSREESDEADPGVVLSQDPSSGSVDEGSTVSLVVAKEPEDVTVPDVVGRSESEASEALSAAGLEVDIQEEPVDSLDDDDRVLSQSPSGDGSAPRGSRVTITIGRFDDSQLDPDPEPGADEGAGGTPEERRR